MSAFDDLAGADDPPLDVLALAIAAAFGTVDERAALDELDGLGAQLTASLLAAAPTPAGEAHACAALLGEAHGFAGDREDYDDPGNSMLDTVLRRRRGLPILLSVVYLEVARRADVDLHGVGLPGHFVVGHFGARPPVLLDPFAGGAGVDLAPGAAEAVVPWSAQEIAMRMLNNLTGSYQRRGALGPALQAATMRLALPCDPALRTTLQAEQRALQARLN